jgi:hypothetical protein
MLPFSSVFHTPLIATVSMPIPSAPEYKNQLEQQFNQFSDYYVLLFSVMALVFIVKGIVL